MTLAVLAPSVKPAPHVAGYLRLTRKRYGPSTGPVEDVVWVKATDVQLVEAHYADQSDRLIGTTLTLVGGARVYALQSVDAVMALLSTLEDSRADR